MSTTTAASRLGAAASAAAAASVQQEPTRSEPQGPRPDDVDAKFASVVLGQTEDSWKAIFAEHGEQYQPPRMVLYDDAHPTGCGNGQGSVCGDGQDWIQRS